MLGAYSRIIQIYLSFFGEEGNNCINVANFRGKKNHSLNTLGLYGVPGGKNVLKHHNKFMKRNLDQVYNLFLGDRSKKGNKHKTI